MRRFVMVVALIAAGCGGSTGTNPPRASGTSIAGTPAASPTTASFAAITLEGTGKKVPRFTIPANSAAIAEATYSGAGTFAITSVAADGNTNDLLVNTTGAYEGTVLFDASGEQTVAFEVDATGAWTIVVKPVSSARIWDGTATLTGNGDDVVQISPASTGLVTLDLDYKGERNFAVTAIAGEADDADLLANATGTFTGQVLLPPGSLLLTVRASGPWSAKPG